MLIFRHQDGILLCTKKIMEPYEKERNKRVFENIPVLLLLLPTSSPPKLKIPPNIFFFFSAPRIPPWKTLPLLPPKEKPSSSLSPTLLFTDQQAWAPQPPSGRPSPIFLKKNNNNKKNALLFFFPTWKRVYRSIKSIIQNLMWDMMMNIIKSKCSLLLKNLK